MINNPTNKNHSYKLKKKRLKNHPKEKKQYSDGEKKKKPTQNVNKHMKENEIQIKIVTYHF